MLQKKHKRKNTRTHKAKPGLISDDLVSKKTFYLNKQLITGEHNPREVFGWVEIFQKWRASSDLAGWWACWGPSAAMPDLMWRKQSNSGKPRRKYGIVCVVTGLSILQGFPFLKKIDLWYETTSPLQKIEVNFNFNFLAFVVSFFWNDMAWV